MKVVRYLIKKVAQKGEKGQNVKNVEKERKIASEVFTVLQARAMKFGNFFRSHEKKVKAHMIHGLTHNLY
jgi:hypothetical protein